MSKSAKIKSLLVLRDKSTKDLATHLGITEQALRNKYNRDSFSTDDLIKIAQFVDCELCLISDDVKVSFTDEDMKQ